ncbi:EcsC family protein [Bacillus kwashiorkori]|uniref:EcsC family protein n=1 Tax=Bacillus kwashiorkori TaxID=1522318 RepID=UPI0007855FC7|nr:EcsC family protein [Bacillus kwashiorkori]
MELTKYEREIWEQIKNWEQEQLNYVAYDFEYKVDQWIEATVSKLPENIQNQFFKQLDQWIFFIQTAIQQTESLDKRIERLLTEAKTTHTEIETINDLKILPIEYLNLFADRQSSIHQLYSLFQGASLGTKSNILLLADLPAMAVINLRAIQLISISYGYDVKKPFEMMMALKIFHCATLPKRFRNKAWFDLLDEVKKDEVKYFYDGNEQLTDTTWLTAPIMQVLKLLLITLFRNKKEDRFSFVSMFFGAGLNYHFTKNITEFAKRFYQYRYISEKIT